MGRKVGNHHFGLNGSISKLTVPDFHRDSKYQDFLAPSNEVKGPLVADIWIEQRVLGGSK